MSSPFIGEIRLVGFSFPPQGWAFCDGQVMPIVQNEALFTLLGTTYGGDGQSTFALPDLRGRMAIHQGTANGLGSYIMGQRGGVETVTVTTSQLPAHSHALEAGAGLGTTNSPTNSHIASAPLGLGNVYNSTSDGTMNAGAVASSGGSQPHSNLMPFLAGNYIISLFGIFPSQN